MNPPKELVDRLLAGGEHGILTSVVLLGAALEIKDGRDPKVTDVSDLSGRPVSAQLRARIVEAATIAAEGFRHATPLELDCAIALYSAHLKAAGYTVEFGREN